MRERGWKINFNKKILVPIIISVIVIILIGLIGILYYLNKEIEYDTTLLVINNRNVTERVQKEIIIEDGVIYLSKEDISNFFDRYLYEDEETEKIITTSDTKMATLEMGSNKIEINGQEETINATPIERNDTYYLPISEMTDVYNIEITYISSSDIVVIDSLSKGQTIAYTTEDVTIKESARTLSRCVEKVEEGNWVIYISDIDEDWVRVRTQDGKLGYLKKSKLTNITTVREETEEEVQIEGKVNLVWDYYSEYASAPDRTGTEIEGVNVVSPSFFYINEEGEFEENIGTSGLEYIEWAKSNGYKVWPMLSNAGAGIEVTSQILNDYYARQELIQNIVNACIEYDLDGINMDFENMYQEDKDMYSRLIIELTPQLKELGMVISVDVTAPDGAETWSLCFDRNVIGYVADYIIFMAYDQHGSSSKEAGTTAGYNWVETNLKKFIETEDIDSEKIILGIPFYTRIWTEEDGEVTSKTVNMNAVDDVIPDTVERTWDDTLKQYYVEYTEGNAVKKMWIEDVNSIREKVSLVSTYNLGGVAAWEKDREVEEVWSVIEEALQ